MKTRTTIAAALAALTMPLGSLALAAPAEAGAPDTARKARPATVWAKVKQDVVVRKEDKVVVKGRVKPRLRGQKVVLQQRVGDKKRWKKTGVARTNRKGKFTLRDNPSTQGSREYRVVKPRQRGFRKAVSKPMDVQVYAWERLARRSAGAREGAFVASTHLASEWVRGSLVLAEAGTPGYIEYTLGRMCTELRTTHALADHSATGSTGQITLELDGETELDQPLVVGQLEDVTVDLTDVFRLRYEMTSSADPAGYPVVATPMVLCTR